MTMVCKLAPVPAATPVLFQCFGQDALERLRVVAEGDLASETF
ncbi:hypothetical protein ABNQ38_05665 [Azospirillum sp. A29]